MRGTILPVSVPYFLPVVFRNGRWRADKVHTRGLFLRLCREAGLPESPHPHPPDAADRLLTAGVKYHIGLEYVEGVNQPKESHENHNS